MTTPLRFQLNQEIGHKEYNRLSPEYYHPKYEYVESKSFSQSAAPIFSAKFNPKIHSLLAISNEDGLVSLVDTSQEYNHAHTSEWYAHENAVLDLMWVDGKNIATASGDHTVCIWDCVAQTKICQLNGHEYSVKCVRNQKLSPHLLASGSRDGKIFLWDLRQADKKILSVQSILTQPSKQKQNIIESITGMEFVRDHILIASNAPYGEIKFWDFRYLRKGVPKQVGTSSIEMGTQAPSSLCTDSTGTRLFANYSDNHIYEYNTFNPSSPPINKFTTKGFRCDSFFLKGQLDRTDEYYACGSSDGTLYVWNINEPKFFSNLLVDCSEINCVVWDVNNWLYAASDEGNIRVFKPENL